jgi:hypothetical protein
MSIPCRSGSAAIRKVGAAFGHAKVQGKELLFKGLNALISVISTPAGRGPVRAARGQRRIGPWHRRPGRWA